MNGAIHVGGGLDRPPHPTPGIRPLARGAVVLVVAVLLGGCGSGSGGAAGGQASDRQPASRSSPLGRISGVQQRIVGRGAEAAVILSSARRVKPRSTTILLHAWSPVPGGSNAPWIAHLVRRGSVVIYPIYQDFNAKPQVVLANAVSGIRRAFASPGTSKRPLIVAGATTGAALAADYAASAPAAHLPVPAAIFAVYPGRDPGVGVIHAVDPTRIVPTTRLTVVGGDYNPVVDGAAEVKRMLRGASNIPQRRRRYLVGADPSPGGPQEADAAARRSFWAPLDLLIKEARGGGRRGPR